MCSCLNIFNQFSISTLRFRPLIVIVQDRCSWTVLEPHTLIPIPRLICSFPNINIQGVTEQSPEFKEPLLSKTSLQSQEPQTL